MGTSVDLSTTAEFVEKTSVFRCEIWLWPLGSVGDGEGVVVYFWVEVALVETMRPVFGFPISWAMSHSDGSSVFGVGPPAIELGIEVIHETGNDAGQQADEDCIYKEDTNGDRDGKEKVDEGVPDSVSAIL